MISSPPYAGTYDYLEHHELRLLLLGLPSSALDSLPFCNRHGRRTGLYGR